MAVSLSMGLGPIAAVVAGADVEERKKKKQSRRPAREAGEGRWGVGEEES